MTWSWVGVVVVLAGLVLLWVLLLVLLWRASPGEVGVREGMRLLPDVLRLLRRLVTDRALPRGVRVRLWLLLGYLALPIDLVPDVLPVIGYADDVVLVVLVLRSVVRRAGPEAVARHWPGSEAGLRAVLRLVGGAREGR